MSAGAGEESDLLLADLIITDPVLIDLILDGKREISCGYTYELCEENGAYIQRKIRGNHVAVVDAGRAGKRVAIRDERHHIHSKGVCEVPGVRQCLESFAELFTGSCLPFSILCVGEGKEILVCSVFAFRYQKYKVPLFLLLRHVFTHLMDDRLLVDVFAHIITASIIEELLDKRVVGINVFTKKLILQLFKDVIAHRAFVVPVEHVVVCRVWAAVTDAGNQHYRAADVMNTEAVINFTIRYREDIKPGMWVRFQGEKWNISTLGEYSFKRTYLGLKASLAKGVSG